MRKFWHFLVFFFFFLHKIKEILTYNLQGTLDLTVLVLVGSFSQIRQDKGNDSNFELMLSHVISGVFHWYVRHVTLEATKVCLYVLPNVKQWDINMMAYDRS